jgi:glyoxylase-like metal-dependent hydrolase (beta-lactamase superfamily II)
VIRALRVGDAQGDRRALEEGVGVVEIATDVEGELVVALGELGVREEVPNATVRIGLELAEQLGTAVIGKAKKGNANPGRWVAGGEVEDVRADGRSLACHACIMTDAPAGRSARFDILLEGSPGERTVSTCSLIREGSSVVIVDPGLAPSQAAILDPLAALGLSADDVTDVVLSHHHPDHTLNVSLFPRARVHDHWAIYDFAGRWDSVEAEGRVLAPSVRLIRTPGHSAEDISTVVGTPEGVVVFTHLWWTGAAPVEDPYAPDPAVLHVSRARVLGFADLVVPGHGAPFVPGASTPP